jgi:transmembrane protein TMEM260 (protein O-mannosyltransferase)
MPARVSGTKKRKKKRAADPPAPPPKRAAWDASRTSAPPPERRREFRIGLAIAIVSVAAFYGATMCRWIGLGDTAMLIDDMVRLTLSSHVNNHRIVVVFGHLFSKLPFGELAWRCHLTSVFFGTAAMSTFYVIAYRTVGRLVPALVATFAATVIHSMWWHATIVENYAVNALATCVVLLLLLQDEERPDSKRFYWACVVSGLAVVNHVQMGFLAPTLFVYAIYQRKKQSYGLVARWLKMAGFYLVGLSPFLLVLAIDVAKMPDWHRVIKDATGGDFQKRMFDTSINIYRDLFVVLLVQFPSPMLFFSALGVNYVGSTRWYGKTSVALSIGFLVNTIFFMQFQTWDKFAFMLPSLLILAYWAVVGMRAALEWTRERHKAWRGALVAATALCVAMPPAFYAELPYWGRSAGFWFARYNNQFTRNTHDGAAYVANPDKSHWNDVDVYARLLFDALPQGAIYLDDDARVFYPIRDYYQKHLGLRRDLQVMMINSWGFGGWGITDDAFAMLAARVIHQRPIFLVSRMFPEASAVEKLAARGIVARRFPLDDRHWVYRLEILEAGAEPLTVLDAEVGEGFHQGGGIARTDFGFGDAIQVRIEIAKNEVPVEIVFEWHDPTGEVYFQSEPFSLPAGNTSVWSSLDRSDRRRRGRWQVDVVAGGEHVGAALFTVGES